MPVQSAYNKNKNNVDKSEHKHHIITLKVWNTHNMADNMTSNEMVTMMISDPVVSYQFKAAHLPLSWTYRPDAFVCLLSQACRTPACFHPKSIILSVLF